MAMTSHTRVVDALVGSETGLLKSLEVSSTRMVSTNVEHPNFSSKMAKEHEITCMAWHQDEERVALATRGGLIKTYEKSSQSFVEVMDTDMDEEDVIKGIVCLNNELVVTATQNGNIKVWRHDDDNDDDDDVKKDVFEVNVIDAAVGVMGKKAKLNRFRDDQDRVEHMRKLKSGSQLTSLTHHVHQRHHVATAGKECELSVWDLNCSSSNPLFRAKNVVPDKLQLRVPVWTTDTSFLDVNNVATVSRYGHIRLYDVRGQQRRPIAQRVAMANDGKETLTAMASVDSHSVLVGSARGTLGLYDFRHRGKNHSGLVRKFEGCVGSVRGIAYANDHFVAVGLDRFIRLFSLRNKKPLQQLYLKSRLNCVLLRSQFDPSSDKEPEAKKRKNDEDDNSDDEDNNDDDDIRSYKDDDDDDESEVVVLD